MTILPTSRANRGLLRSLRVLLAALLLFVLYVLLRVGPSGLVHSLMLA